MGIQSQCPSTERQRYCACRQETETWVVNDRTDRGQVVEAESEPDCVVPDPRWKPLCLWWHHCPWVTLLCSFGECSLQIFFRSPPALYWESEKHLWLKNKTKKQTPSQGVLLMEACMLKKIMVLIYLGINSISSPLVFLLLALVVVLFLTYAINTKVHFSFSEK